MSKVLCKKLDVQQVWKPHWIFPSFFKRNHTLQNMKVVCIFSRFFQRNSTLSSTKITYTFSNVLLKKLDLCKIWKAPSFILGFFKDTQSNFVFLFEILEFSVLGFLFIVMEKARPLNITCRCFPLQIYTFIQALLKYWWWWVSKRH
jgi:hypothetical protein